MAANNVSVPYFLGDSLKGYSEDFYIKDNQNPFLILLNGREYSIHASEIHDSGNGRTNSDEWRIQLQAATKQKQIERFRNGIVCLYIGFFPDGKVFSAWEPERIRRLNAEGTGSVYIPHSDIEKVVSDGFAVRTVRATKLNRQSPEISLPIDLLGLYIENHAIFQSVSDGSDLSILLASSQPLLIYDNITEEKEVELAALRDRQRVVTTRLAFTRDPRFRDAVMRAYDGRCCVCSRQLGLVQAAHIIPHSHVDSQNLVSNGLALCIEHHRLYDDALLLPTSNQRLHLNENRVEHLQNIGQGGGIEQLRLLSAQLYRVPDHAPSHPNGSFLERGVNIRLGIDS
jgi:putative restriction endonuclease